MSFLISVLIMFFITKEADLELYSALLPDKEGGISDDDYEKKYSKRIGWIGAKLTNFIIDHHLIK